MNSEQNNNNNEDERILQNSNVCKQSSLQTPSSTKTINQVLNYLDDHRLQIEESIFIRYTNHHQNETVPTTQFTYNTVAATNAAASSTAQTADLTKFTAAGGVLITPSPLTSPAVGKPVGVTNRGPSAWGNLVASESDIIQYNSTTGKWNVVGVQGATIS